MGKSALVLLALCAAAVCQETKRYEDPAKVFGLDLPAAWEVKTWKADRENVVLRLTAKVAGVEGTLYLDLWSLDKIALTARAQARYDRPRQVKSFTASRSEIVLDPVPYVRLNYDTQKGDACVAAFAYKRKLCRCLVLALKCLRTEWPDIKDAYLKAAQGMSSTLGRYPEIPEGYERHEHAGFVFWSAPGFKPSARKRIQNIVAEKQTWFVKLHGPIERPPSEPPYVFLHTFKRDARRLAKWVAESELNQLAHVEARAIYATPVPALRSRGHTLLATQIHRLLFAERYGEVYPSWVQAGGSELFAERVRTGRKLPFVTEAWKEGFPTVVLGLDQLEPIHDTTDWDTYVNHGMAYTLLFRLGPSKYRKAYAAFLETLRAHGDWDKALKDHLYVLDQRELMEAANAVLARKVKGVEPHR